MNDVDLKNPDIFSTELHFALLSEGLRGPLHRKLMRISRSDAELGRIYETKLGEFRRYLRISRRPTLWNLPTRVMELLSDTVKVTPPREVFMTLVYVVAAVMVLELAKRQWFSSEPTSELSSGPLHLDIAYRDPNDPAPLTRTHFPQLDDWMIAELERVCRSDAWRAALARHMSESLRQVDVTTVKKNLPSSPQQIALTPATKNSTPAAHNAEQVAPENVTSDEAVASAAKGPTATQTP